MLRQWLLKGANRRWYRGAPQQRWSPRLQNGGGRQGRTVAQSWLWRPVAFCAGTCAATYGACWAVARARGPETAAERRRADQRTVVAFMALNAGVFAAWQLSGAAGSRLLRLRVPPTLAGFMERNFMHDALSGRLHTLLTANVSQMSLAHIGFNIYAFYQFAPVVQQALARDSASPLGGLEFAWFLTAAGLAAALSSHLWTVGGALRAIRAGIAPTAAASLGASGVVYGVLGFCAAERPDLRVSLLFLPFTAQTLGTLFPLVLAAESAVLLLTPWRMFDHAAHIGGAVFGYLYARYRSRRAVSWRGSQSF